MCDWLSLFYFIITTTPSKIKNTTFFTIMTTAKLLSDTHLHHTMVHHYTFEVESKLQLHGNKQSGFAMPFLNFSEMHLNCLNRLFTVSWWDLTWAFHILWYGWWKASGVSIKADYPLYPLSASHLSPASFNIHFKPCLKMLISGHAPAGNGPLIQTMSPVWIDNATSYRKPGPLNLWE